MANENYALDRSGICSCSESSKFGDVGMALVGIVAIKVRSNIYHELSLALECVREALWGMSLRLIKLVTDESAARYFIQTRAELL